MKITAHQILSNYYRPLIFWAGLLMLTLMLTGCPPTDPMHVRGEIEPKPIVGQIFTLHIDAVSEKFSDDGVITVQMSDEISVVSLGSDWEQKPLVNPEGEIVGKYYEWQGYFVVDKPQAAELSLCVTRPGNFAIYFSAGVGGIAFDDDKLYINSAIDTAEVLTIRQHSRTVRANSTRAPTPEPVPVSAECLGNN